ncbi:MAG: GrpB family protein [Phycisphaerales bacterium]|nr:GrpB family protein [Phycisphaerales bacterium]
MIVVAEHDPGWAVRFAEIRAGLGPALAGREARVEHVGSTSVPGLAAKPIIDISVIVPDADGMHAALSGLSALGYEHIGDLGITGREALRATGGVAAGWARHNLYVCIAGGPGIRNHLAVRDDLRADPDAARAYGELKRRLARECGDDVDAYTQAKSAFLAEVLTKAGVGASLVAQIQRENTQAAAGGEGDDDGEQ